MNAKFPLAAFALVVFVTMVSMGIDPAAAQNADCSIQQFEISHASPIAVGELVILQGTANCTTVRFEFDGVPYTEDGAFTQSIGWEVSSTNIGSHRVCFAATNGAGWESAHRQCVDVSITATPGQSANPVTVSPSGSACQHIVASGENLSRIGNRYGVLADDIVSANGLQDNPDLIHAGLVLTIPNCDPSETAATNSVVAAEPVVAAPTSNTCQHVVGRDESLSKIGRRYGVLADSIARANGLLENPDLIHAGLVLIIPNCEPSQIVAQNNLVPEEPAPAAEPIPDNSTVVVEPVPVTESIPNGEQDLETIDVAEEPAEEPEPDNALESENNVPQEEPPPLDDSESQPAENAPDSVAPARDEESTVWTLSNTLSIDELPFEFLYPEEWVFSFGTGSIVVASSEEDLSLEADGDTATIPTESTITLNAIPLESIGLTADADFSVVRDQLLSSETISVEEVFEIPVLLRPSITFTGTGADGRHGMATIWVQNEFLLVFSLNTPDAQTTRLLSFDWGVILGSLRPKPTLELASPLAIPSTGISIQYPEGWTVNMDTIPVSFVDEASGSSLSTFSAPIADFSEEGSLESVAEVGQPIAIGRKRTVE